MPSSNENQIGETLIETSTTRRSKRAMVAKSFRYDFQVYLVEGPRDEIVSHSDKDYTIPLDPTINLMPNTCRVVDQLAYSRTIGCLIYAMTSTRPYIAYVVGKLSRYTSNLSTHHWYAIMRVFKYLKKTMDYGLSYVGYPSVLEGYSDASWITNLKDHTSTTNWVFWLGEGAISRASKK
ncbi:hypothetical protein Tco_1199463 [Tanacetum coccineum]